MMNDAPSPIDLPDDEPGAVGEDTTPVRMATTRDGSDLETADADRQQVAEVLFPPELGVVRA